MTLELLKTKDSTFQGPIYITSFSFLVDQFYPFIWPSNLPKTWPYWPTWSPLFIMNHRLYSVRSVSLSLPHLFSYPLDTWYSFPHSLNQITTKYKFWRYKDEWDNVPTLREHAVHKKKRWTIILQYSKCAAQNGHVLQGGRGWPLDWICNTMSTDHLEKVSVTTLLLCLGHLL